MSIVWEGKISYTRVNWSTSPCYIWRQFSSSELLDIDIRLHTQKGSQAMTRISHNPKLSTDATMTPLSSHSYSFLTLISLSLSLSLFLPPYLSPSSLSLNKLPYCNIRCPIRTKIENKQAGWMSTELPSCLNMLTHVNLHTSQSYNMYMQVKIDNTITVIATTFRMGTMSTKMYYL